MIGGVEALAAGGGLTVSRMPLAFLTLRRNTTVWRTRAFPRPGERMTFGSDPAVFQYWPGRGVQFHPLATAGRANALATPCLAAAEAARRVAARRAARAPARRRAGLAPVAHARPAPRCRARGLARRLDRLVALASRRDGFTAWEYAFSYAGSRPYWISAMAQATAAQALARGAAALGRPVYRRAALSALKAFDVPAPTGVRSGSWYAMYSFDPSYRILNGFLQSLIGLHDVAELTGSAHARRLFASGERVARRAVAGYDTGAWSLYAAHGNESTLSYHELLTGFLEGLCARTARPVYCSTGRRFAFYEREPPAIHLQADRRAREDRAAAVSVWVSKVSDLRVTVRDRRGAEPLSIVTHVPRGSYRWTWVPPRAGRFRVTVSAVGPEGRRGTARAVVRAKPKPRPRHRAKPKPRHRAKPKPRHRAKPEPTPTPTPSAGAEGDAGAGSDARGDAEPDRDAGAGSDARGDADPHALPLIRAGRDV